MSQQRQMSDTTPRNRHTRSIGDTKHPTAPQRLSAEGSALSYIVLPGNPHPSLNPPQANSSKSIRSWNKHALMSRAVAPAPVPAAVPSEARLRRHKPDRASSPSALLRGQRPGRASPAAPRPRWGQSGRRAAPAAAPSSGGAQGPPWAPRFPRPAAQRSPARRCPGGSGRGLARGSRPRPRYLRAAASCWAGSRPGWTSRAPLGPAAEPEGGRAAPPRPAPPRPGSGASPAPARPRRARGARGAGTSRATWHGRRFAPSSASPCPARATPPPLPQPCCYRRAPAPCSSTPPLALPGSRLLLLNQNCSCRRARRHGIAASLSPTALATSHPPVLGLATLEQVQEAKTLPQDGHLHETVSCLTRTNTPSFLCWSDSFALPTLQRTIISEHKSAITILTNVLSLSEIMLLPTYLFKNPACEKFV